MSRNSPLASNNPGDEIPSKRPNGESQSGSNTRSKREKYTSIACNECKKRKVKCDGEVQCRRCANLDIDCIYPSKANTSRAGRAGRLGDTDDFERIDTKMSSLQAQIDVLFANLGPFLDPSTPSAFDSWTRFPKGQQALHTSTSLRIPINTSPLRSNHLPQFLGPTSSAYGFRVANSSLKSMGIQSGTKAGEQDVLSHPVSPSVTPSLPPALDASRDPLWDLEQDEALRLIEVYEEEIGSIYPFLDGKKIESHAIHFYNTAGGAPVTTDAMGVNVNARAGGMMEHDVQILKLILAIGLIVEGKGESYLGTRLAESAENYDRTTRNARADEQGILRLMLLSHYYFLSDEESLAWRIIGLAARMALEMGLHRLDTLIRRFPEQPRRLWTVNLFWCIYVLDRRWSFGTGMPFALQDSDIDPNLPEPDHSTPYLTCMVAYSRLGSKVWKSLATFGSTPSRVKKEEMAYLDFQVLQWQQSIPSELQHSKRGFEQESRAIQRHRVLLHLRANHMRSLIYRQNVLSATSIADDLVGAQLVVDLAKETINILNRLNQTTDIYRSLQVCFNYFLVSALAILFLAVCHAPARFSETSRTEYYMALDLVKGFSTKSTISRRLWRTIEDLKTIGPKLGVTSQDKRLPGDDSGTRTPLVNAGVMGGLASYPTDAELDMCLNGAQMSYDLTNMFEAAGNSVLEVNGTDGGIVLDGIEPSHIDNYAFGNEEILSRIMSDLF